MLDFDYFSPTRLILGKGKELQVAEQILQCGATKVLIHYGSGSVVRSGLLTRVKATLQQAGIAFVELGGVVANPLDTLVYRGIQLCKDENVDFVLGVGGGSVIDSAKAIAIGACDDGDFFDFYLAKRKPLRRLGLGTIITLMATGTEASNSSVIKREHEPLKRGLRSDLNRPDFSIINPELTFTLPLPLVAAGSADMMAHIMERYFTQTTAVSLTDELCEGALRSIIYETPTALANPNHYDARANLFFASTVAHVGLLGMGRQEDWSMHAIEAELGGAYNTTHGAGLAAIYPAWLLHILPHQTMRIARFADKVLGIPLDFTAPERSARLGIQALSRLFVSWGLPQNLQAMNVPFEDLPTLTKRTKRNPDGTCGWFLPLRDADILAIYEKAWDFDPSFDR
ncbi:MAG: iron-containing alcohol dehydrogenase [Eubacteriales bacterium]|nr:iron-containing alcohol dehydrogenase [Eubacteriales bacterium]